MLFFTQEHSESSSRKASSSHASGDTRNSAVRCYACMELMIGSTTSSVYRGEPVHGSCEHGIRSYKRTIRHNETEIALEKKDFAVNPVAWRKRIKEGGFLKDMSQGGSRKGAIGAKEVEMFQRDQYHDTSKLRDKIELNLQQYIAWRKRVENANDDDEEELNFLALWKQKKLFDEATESEKVVWCNEPLVRRQQDGDRSADIS